MTARQPQQVDGRLKVLRIVLSIGETNAAYNQFSLPLVDKQNITICTYFASKFKPTDKITLFQGNNTLRGFFRALRSALAVSCYDVVHTHSSHVGVFYLAATLFKSRKVAPRAIFTLHNSFSAYKARHKLLLIPVFLFSAKVVCCGQASYDSVPRLYRWLARDRLCRISNGVNLDRVDEVVRRERETRGDDQFSLLTVGRLIEVKNPFVLLESLRESDDRESRLTFIGEGHLRDDLSKWIRKFNFHDRVKLTGLIPREQVYRHLLGSDVFVSTSRVEGMPIAVLEAMACRCPVILSDIPSHREVADSVDFIPLIDPDDIKGFAEEIQRFRRMPVKDRVQIGLRCRELVEQKFSLNAMLDAYNAVYSEVCNGRPLSAR